MQTIYAGPVAGVSHAHPDFNVLAMDDPIHAIAEPQNAFDPRAVRLHHQRAGKLGYMPKESTVAFYDAVANGFHIYAKVISFEAEGRYPKISVQLWIKL